jgi:hypothetical protein
MGSVTQDKHPVAVVLETCSYYPVRPAHRWFYRVVLPLLALANLLLGVVNLMALRDLSTVGATQSTVFGAVLATGAFCCAVAGGLVAVGLVATYWSAVARRQLGTWQILAETIVHWVERSGVSDEALVELRRSLDDALGHR